MEPKLLTIEVLKEYAEERWTLSEFMVLLADAAAEIPEQYREMAVVDLEGSYEETGAIIISYQRMETAEEVAKRVSEREAYLRSEAQREYNQYMALKRKFG